MRILVAAALTLEPFSAGIAWDWIQILVGLERLGHDVYFVEALEPGWAVDRKGRRASYRDSVNRRRFASLTERFGFRDRACQLYDGGRETTGLGLPALLRVAEDADLLLNISGHLADRRILERVSVRAYVDQDPVYTQLWRAEYGKDLGFGHHDVFFTVGLEVGRPACPVPAGDVQWHHLLPPVVPDLWAVREAPRGRPFTTVASLTGYATLRHAGRRYGGKYHEFARFKDLPRMTDQPLEVALKAFREDDPLIRGMREAGWRITDAGALGGLSEYQAYLAGSRAEIGIAQEAYVDGRSGWFSDRSTHYLATGKPVLAQATGFERHLEVGEGLIAFSTPGEARDGIEAVNSDYRRHCRAARELAEGPLDYRAVLPPVLEACHRPGRSGAARAAETTP